MTKEEAIKILEKDMKNATDAYSYHLAGGGVIDCELEDYFDAMYSAMDALREQDSLAKKTSDKKTSEWISVEERLPEPFVSVLAWDADWKTANHACVTQHNEWYGVVLSHRITHWMPLPEPPEVEIT